MNNKALSRIDSIIENISMQESSLENILLNTQILAFELKNEKLKKWVNNELNGYETSDEIPSFRIVKTEVIGNLMQGLGTPKYTKWPNVPIPIEYLDNETFQALKTHTFITRISELEKLSHERNLIINLPYLLLVSISHIMQPWDVVKVWKRIPPSTFTGILSTIKSNLLTFLLELKEELGDENIPLMSKKKEIDKLFDKNINNITATTVYIANGDKSIQSTTTDNAKTEIVQKNIEGNYSDDALKNDLKDLLAIFRKLEQETELEDADEINGELSRIEIQTKKEQPKRKIIKQSLETLKSVAINIASNGISTPVLGKIGEIISFLG